MTLNNLDMFSIIPNILVRGMQETEMLMRLCRRHKDGSRNKRGGKTLCCWL